MARFVLIPLGLVVGFGAACLTEEKVEQRIEDANYCDVADDCVDLGGQCPFGCWILVNESEATDIRKLLERYEKKEARKGQHCVYSCPAYSAIECEEGRCEAVQ